MDGMNAPDFVFPCFACNRRGPMEEFLTDVSRQLGDIQREIGEIHAKVNAVIKTREDDAPAIATAKWIRGIILALAVIGGPVGSWAAIAWLKKHWP